MDYRRDIFAMKNYKIDQNIDRNIGQTQNVRTTLINIDMRDLLQAYCCSYKYSKLSKKQQQQKHMTSDLDL